MSDHLLRLARIVEDVSFSGYVPRSVGPAIRGLIRDLEAVPDRNVLPTPATERRTITREERDAGAQQIASILGWPNDSYSVRMADACAAAWRLTVVDA